VKLYIKVADSLKAGNSKAETMADLAINSYQYNGAITRGRKHGIVPKIPQKTPANLMRKIGLKQGSAKPFLDPDLFDYLLNANKSGETLTMTAARLLKKTMPNRIG